MILFLFALSVPGFAQGNCTRADLKAAVDGYLAAQRGGNPSALPLTASAKYIENTVETTLDKSIVTSALKIDFNRSIFDATICETFTEVIVTDRTHPYVLGVRTKVANKRIAELETLVTDADDWLFNADNYLMYSPSENWSAIPAASRDIATNIDRRGERVFRCDGRQRCKGAMGHAVQPPRRRHSHGTWPA